MRNRKKLREKNLGQGMEPEGVGRGTRGPMAKSRTEETQKPLATVLSVSAQEALCCPHFTEQGSPREIEKPPKAMWSLSEVRLGLPEGAFPTSCVSRVGCSSVLGYAGTEDWHHGRGVRCRVTGTPSCQSRLVHVPP